MWTAKKWWAASSNKHSNCTHKQSQSLLTFWKKQATFRPSIRTVSSATSNSLPSIYFLSISSKMVSFWSTFWSFWGGSRRAEESLMFGTFSMLLYLNFPCLMRKIWKIFLTMRRNSSRKNSIKIMTDSMRPTLTIFSIVSSVCLARVSTMTKTLRIRSTSIYLTCSPTVIRTIRSESCTKCSSKFWRTTISFCCQSIIQVWGPANLSRLLFTKWCKMAISTTRRTCL